MPNIQVLYSHREFSLLYNIMGELDIRRLLKRLVIEELNNQTIKDTTPVAYLEDLERTEKATIDVLNEYRASNNLPTVNVDAEVDLLLKGVWQSSIIDVYKVWNVIAIPWTCFVLGNYGVSDKHTYDIMRDMLEKGRLHIPIVWGTKTVAKILAAWQFGWGLKFIYAALKYIVTKRITAYKNTYSVKIDADFMQYFEEANTLFSFLGKSTTTPSIDNSQYWRSNKSYANKILSYFTSLKVIPQKTHSDSFFIEDSP